MKRLVVASLVCMAFATGSAIAADMPVKAPPMVAARSWTGCYGGLEAAFGWQRYRGISNGTTNGVANPAATGAGVTKLAPFEGSNMMGGIEAGCNYQVSSVVFGIEGTFDGVGGSATTNLAAPFNTNFQDQITQRWLGTVRGRLGILATPDLLFFVTGGVAWSQFNDLEFSNPISITGVSASENDNTWGWTVGAGGEYWLPNTAFSIKAEYMFIQFSNFNTFNSTASGCCTSQSTQVQEHLFKVGLNYHFNWAGPVVAKY